MSEALISFVFLKEHCVGNLMLISCEGDCVGSLILTFL